MITGIPTGMYAIMYHANLIQLLEKKYKSAAEKIMPAISIINDIAALMYDFFCEKFSSFPVAFIEQLPLLQLLQLLISCILFMIINHHLPHCLF